MTGILLFISFSFFLFRFSFAQAPATQPAAEIQKWFGQLADDDPETREEARFNLMGLSRAELAQLREVAAQNRPLAPAQSAALREIVTHVYLTGEPYETMAGVGFMGAQLGDVRRLAGGVPGEEVETPDGLVGTLVMECVPGFCAFRYLRPGDLIIGVVGPDFEKTADSDRLRQKIRETPSGQTITLQILRRREVKRVTFKLDPKPAVAERMMSIDELRAPRGEAAGAYWKEAFEPLISGPAS